MSRQQSAVRRYAKAQRLNIVREFYDAGVSGRDSVEARLEFSEMLKYLADNQVSIVLVESASRFARDYMVQRVGYEMLCKRGVTLIPVDAPTHFAEDTPTAKLVRGILGVIAEFEKDGLVDRLARGRQRKRLHGHGRWVGRKTIAERAPAAAARALELRATGQHSLRAIAALLAAEGHLASNGRAYSAASLTSVFERAAA